MSIPLSPYCPQDAADRLTERVSSLETKLLEGRAALALVKADKDAIALELVDAKEASVRMGEQKEEIVEAKAREEALRMEVDTTKNTLQVTVKVNGAY